MKTVFLILFLGISSVAYSQSISEIDSFSYVLCTTLNDSEIKDDMNKVRSLFQDHINPYVSSFNSSKSEKVGRQVYFRLQRNCVEFRRLLNILDPPKELGSRTTEKPKSELSKKQLKAFKKRKNFYYFEVNGDTTRVTMDKGNWTDSFSDGTFSKLTYDWTDDADFELVFIESNNEGRSNFSIKGDKFIYRVLSEGEDYYTLLVNIEGQDVFEQLKMYYE